MTNIKFHQRSSESTGPNISTYKFPSTIEIKGRIGLDQVNAQIGKSKKSRNAISTFFVKKINDDNALDEIKAVLKKDKPAAYIKVKNQILFLILTEFLDDGETIINYKGFIPEDYQNDMVGLFFATSTRRHRSSSSRSNSHSVSQQRGRSRSNSRSHSHSTSMNRNNMMGNGRLMAGSIGPGKSRVMMMQRNNRGYQNPRANTGTPASTASASMGSITDLANLANAINQAKQVPVNSGHQQLIRDNARMCALNPNLMFQLRARAQQDRNYLFAVPGSLHHKYFLQLIQNIKSTQPPPPIHQRRPNNTMGRGWQMPPGNNRYPQQPQQYARGNIQPRGMMPGPPRTGPTGAIPPRGMMIMQPRGGRQPRRFPGRGRMNQARGGMMPPRSPGNAAPPGRGRGRGRGVNMPAWMTNGS